MLTPDMLLIDDAVLQTLTSILPVLDALLVPCGEMMVP